MIANCSSKFPPPPPPPPSLSLSPLSLSLFLFLSVPQITEEPHSLENTPPGKPAEFVVKANGSRLTYTWYRQTTKQLLPNDKRVSVGNTQIQHFDKVESRKPTGGSVEENSAQLTTRMLL